MADGRVAKHRTAKMIDSSDTFRKEELDRNQKRINHLRNTRQNDKNTVSTIKNLAPLEANLFGIVPDNHSSVQCS